MCRKHYQQHRRQLKQVDLAAALPYGRIGELAERDGKVLCHACGGWYVRIAGRHLDRHGITEEQYREWAGLSPDRPLAAVPLREHLRRTSRAALASRADAPEWGTIRPSGTKLGPVVNRRPKRIEERLHRRDQAKLVAAYTRLQQLGHRSVASAIEEGWSQARLAAALGVDRRWVRRRLVDEQLGHLPHVRPPVASAPKLDRPRGVNLAAHLTIAQRAQVRRWHHAGMSQAEIARRLGFSPTHKKPVRQLLRDLGLTPHHVGRRTTYPRPPTHELASLQAQCTIQEIADRYGVSRQTVHRWIRHLRQQ